MKRKINLTLIIFIFVTLLSGCSNSGTTVATNPDISGTGTSITIGQLTTEGTAQITIPLAAFGDSVTDLEGASFDIYVNGTARNTGLNPQSYYVSSQQAVMFILTGLNDGDVIMIVIHAASGTEQSYSGAVSADSFSSATAGSSSHTMFTGTPIHIINYSHSDNEVYIPLSIFGNFSDLEDAQVTFRMKAYTDEWNIKTVSAASHYDADTQEIVLDPHDLWDMYIFEDDSFCEIVINKADGSRLFFSPSIYVYATKPDALLQRSDYYLYSLDKTDTDFSREYVLTTQTITYTISEESAIECDPEDIDYPITEALTENLIFTVDNGIVNLDTDLDFIVIEEIDFLRAVYRSDGYFMANVRGENFNSELEFAYLQYSVEGYAYEDSIDFTFTFTFGLDTYECIATQHVLGEAL